MSLWMRKNSMGCFLCVRPLFCLPASTPGRSTGCPTLPMAAAVDEIDQHPRARQDRAEHRGQDAQAIHRKAAHRTGAEDQQGDARDQRGDVGVEDGVEGQSRNRRGWRLGLAPLRSSSRMRSLISTLESIAMPRVSAMAAMPGRVSVACSSDSRATSSSRLAAARSPKRGRTAGSSRT